MVKHRLTWTSTTICGRDHLSELHLNRRVGESVRVYRVTVLLVQESCLSRVIPYVECVRVYGISECVMRIEIMLCTSTLQLEVKTSAWLRIPPCRAASSP